MRTEQEMYSLILDFAQSDQRIRLVGMEGSRTNIHIPRDSFQDYDISFLVTDMDSFRRDDGWLDAFCCKNQRTWSCIRRSWATGSPT